MTALTWDDVSLVIEFVGPHGYSHGWIKEGEDGIRRPGKTVKPKAAGGVPAWIRTRGTGGIGMRPEQAAAIAAEMNKGHVIPLDGDLNDSVGHGHHVAGTPAWDWADLAAVIELATRPPAEGTWQDEPRGRHGEWTGKGGLLPRGSVTVLPADHPANRIIGKWVRQHGSATLTPAERESLSAAVNYYGKQVPAGLVRGESGRARTRYSPGKVIRLDPASFSTEEQSALPYAEAGDRNPVLLHLASPHGVKGLNVSDQASRAGFNEQEWVLAGRYRVTSTRMDSEGIAHVTIVPGP